MDDWGLIKVFPVMVFVPLASALGFFTFIENPGFCPNNLASRILKGHSRGLFV